MTPCCLTQCLPITRPTVLDADNMDKIIYLDQLADDNFSGEEMQELAKTPEAEEENIPSEEANPQNVVECEIEDEKSETDGGLLEEENLSMVKDDDENPKDGK